MLPNSGSQRAPSTGPIKRRRTTGIRAQDACINCKERKLKCDDQLPACANCNRHGLSCLVEYPNTKRRGPRNYVETLEERIAQLETQLRQSEARGDVAHSTSTSRLTDEANSSPPQALGISDDVDERSQLASEVGMLSLNAAGAEPHYLGSSSAFAFSRIVSSSLHKLVPPKPDSTFKDLEEQMSNLTPCPLPDYDTGVKLSNAYFQNIHPQYPFLHEPSFRALEAKLLRPSLEADASNYDLTSLFFINMVYAVGALLTRAEILSKRLYITAQLYIGHVLSDDNLEAIQALLCCAMYSLRSPVGPSIWKLSGLALRQCIELGYHRKVKRFASTAGPLRLEMQKRAFWCAYIIDCVAAGMLGRPLGIPPQEVDAEYPLDIDDSALTDLEICGRPRTSSGDPPTTMSNAIHVFRLRYLWARVHAYLYSDISACNPNHPTYLSRIEQLRAELEHWRASIPPIAPRVGDALTIFNSQDWFDLNYSGTILYLYRGQLIDGRNVSDAVFEECLQAAKSICHGYRRLYVGRPVNYTWGAINVIFMAGLLYLHCLWTSPTVRRKIRQDDFSRTCMDCTMVLVVMAERWDGAAPFRDIFEALASGTMTMMTEEGSKEQESAMPQALASDVDQGDLTRWMAEISDSGTSDWIDTFLTGLIHDHPLGGIGTSGPDQAALGQPAGSMPSTTASDGGIDFAYLDTPTWENP